jgi:hypothetical protein
MSTMSSSNTDQTPLTPSSDFNSILEAALNEYKTKTGRGLLEHPLAEEVKRCDSIGAISTILQGQAREFQQFRDGDQRLMKWINPIVDVLSTFSETLGGVASIVRPYNRVHNHFECILTLLLCRHSPLQAPSLQASVYFFLSVPSPALVVDLS